MKKKQLKSPSAPNLPLLPLYTPLKHNSLLVPKPYLLGRRSDGRN
jgi:hypothetical protein